MSVASSVIVIGAGGHARVVADALLCAGVKVLGFTDTDPIIWGQAHFGLPILGGDDILVSHDPATTCLANGLGMVDARGSLLRCQVQDKLTARGWRFIAVHHPSAIISPRAHLADDVQVLAGAVVQPGASIKVGTIVNSRAVVEHDAHVGAWTHVAPGAVICGDVRIGAHVHVGAGTTVRQGLLIGDHSLVGLGAAVVCDLPPSTIAAGVPARPFKLKQ